MLLQVRVVCIAVALAWTCAPAFSQTANLDAPVSRQPTVRSEIKRGSTDAFRCAMKYDDPDTALKFSGCVEDLVFSNISNSTISDPYLFGLYTAAIPSLKLHIKYIDKSRSKTDYELAPKTLEGWRDHAKELSAKTGLTRSDFCETVSKDPKSCEAAGPD